MGLLKDRLILVVDDDLMVADLFKLTVESEGLRAEVAGDGKIALQKIADLKPDLVILDLMMPNMGGYEVLRKLQADPELNKMPVIVATAKIMDPGTKAVLTEGVNVPEIIEKPVDIEALMKLVHRMLPQEGRK
ncbi:MAG: response regulator [Elusimicrobiota bacterium]